MPCCFSLCKFCWSFTDDWVLWHFLVVISWSHGQCRFVLKLYIYKLRCFSRPTRCQLMSTFSEFCWWECKCALLTYSKYPWSALAISVVPIKFSTVNAQFGPKLRYVLSVRALSSFVLFGSLKVWNSLLYLSDRWEMSLSASSNLLLWIQGFLIKLG